MTLVYLKTAETRYTPFKVEPLQRYLVLHICTCKRSRWSRTNKPGQFQSQWSSTNVAGCGKQHAVVPGYRAASSAVWACQGQEQLCRNSVVGFFGPIFSWCRHALVATMENMGKNNPERLGDSCRAESEPSLGGRATGSPTVGSQLKGLMKTRGARLVWLSLRAGKVWDWTVSCTHVSQVSLAKIQHFSFTWKKTKCSPSCISSFCWRAGGCTLLPAVTLMVSSHCALHFHNNLDSIF